MDGLEKNLFFVVNAINPYGYELVHILSYPNGFRFRFRFDEKWVDEKVINRISDLKAKSGFIVLRDTDTGKLLPIRKITIFDAKKIGGIYYFEYELRNIVCLDSDHKLREKQLDRFNDEFVETNHKIFSQDESSHPLKTHVFLSNLELCLKNTNFNGGDKNIESWANVLSEIKGIRFYDDVQFIYLSEFLKVGCKDKSEFKVEGGRLLLERNSTYQLSVVQHIPSLVNKERTSSDVEIFSDNNVLNLIRSKQRVVGRYDLLKFMFSTPNYPVVYESFFDIEHRPVDKNESSVESKINLPIRIEKSINSIIKHAFVFLLLVALYFLPSTTTYQEHIPALSGYKTIIKDLAIVGFTISILGIIKDIKSFRSR